MLGQAPALPTGKHRESAPDATAIETNLAAAMGPPPLTPEATPTVAARAVVAIATAEILATTKTTERETKRWMTRRRAVAKATMSCFSNQIAHLTVTIPWTLVVERTRVRKLTMKPTVIPDCKSPRPTLPLKSRRSS